MLGLAIRPGSPTLSAARAALIDLDFLRDAWRERGVRRGGVMAATGLSFSRTGAGMAQRLDGGWTAFGSGQARITDRGLLIEAARTNLMTQSQALDAAAWAKNGVTVTADAAPAPDGSGSADLVRPTAASSSFKALLQNFSAVLLTPYVASVFVKAAGCRYVQLFGTSPPFGSFHCNVDLETGLETAFSAGGATVVGRGVEDAGGGWRRVWIALTAGSSVSARLSLNPVPAADSARGVVWGGDGVSGVLMWQYDVQEGSSLASPIVTTAATGSRGADAATLALPAGARRVIVDWGGSRRSEIAVADLADPSLFDFGAAGGRPWVGQAVRRIRAVG